MMPLAARILALSAMNGLTATLLAAIISHVIAADLTAKGMELLDTGLKMQMAGSIALIGAVFLAQYGKPRWAHLSTVTTTGGIILFSGSLYVIAISGPGALGPLHWITPIGGVLLMAGWALLALGAISRTAVPEEL